MLKRPFFFFKMERDSREWNVEYVRVHSSVNLLLLHHLRQCGDNRTLATTKTPSSWDRTGPPLDEHMHSLSQYCHQGWEFHSFAQVGGLMAYARAFWRKYLHSLAFFFALSAHHVVCKILVCCDRSNCWESQWLGFDQCDQDYCGSSKNMGFKIIAGLMLVRSVVHI